MKNHLLLILLFISFNQLLAQNEFQLRFKRSTVSPPSNMEMIDAKSKVFDAALYKGHYYVLVQFEQTPSLTKVEKLESHGVELLQYIPDKAYLTKIDKAVFNKQVWRDGIRHVSIMHPMDKTSPSWDYLESATLANVLFNTRITSSEAQSILSGLYTEWDRMNGDDGNIFKVKLTPENARIIASHPLVSYVSPVAQEMDLLIEESLETSRSGLARHASGLGLTGNGVTVSVGDGGTINDHIDLNDRIQNENLIDDSSHGSQTAGIIASEGQLDPAGIGYAPETTVYADFFTGVIIFDDNYYNNFGVVISNNSYANGIVVSVCADAGEYTAESVDVDQSLRTLDEVTHVFSSGNDGFNTCGAYATGYATLRNAWNSAKNTLVVGNTDYLDGIAGSSSRGPALDGRLKPDMVAVGSNVTSTGNSNNYVTGSGTSFSAPAVSGALALMYEYYKSLNAGANPKGDLMKAVMMNSARDVGNVGPDYIYGFGALDVYRASETLANTRYTTGSISNGNTNTHNITVPAGTHQLKVMLYWHDVEGSASANPALVNDLNLSVDDPGLTNVLPLVLDPSAANCANPAVNGVDNLNNAEQVVIDNPASGTYTINVNGFNVPMGSQDYVIVYDIIEDHLELASPMGGEMYTTSESINITWNGAGYDANTFTLEYSLDNGTNWVVIDNAVSGSLRNYEWTTPTTFTDEGLIRISWNGTGLASKQSLSNFSIMDAPTALTLNPDCDEQVNISWSSVTGAASYDVMQYDGSTWNVLTNTTSTSHLVTGLTAGTTYYFTVRAVSTGGVVGQRRRARSIVAMGSSTASTINTYPYLEDFEADNGDWISFGKNNSWQWGTPSGTLLNRAAEGNNAWATNLTGNYNNSELSYLVSPCYDLSSLSSPVFSFALNYDIEDANDGNGFPYYDRVYVEYSTNGRTWNTMGTNGAGHNWYNNYMGNNNWDDTKSYWHSASFDVPTTASRVQFRIVLDSDIFTTQEGIAIDNVRIYESDDIHTGSDVNVTQAVSGSNWVHFESGGNRVVSINPNGQNLGSTSADVYIHSGTLRDNNLQYYLDRNWKITPTNAPGSDVSVRLYLLDSEVEALRAAAGSCSGCSTITDAFMAGVTKYSGPNENGDLNDNDANTYSFFIPDDVEVVPYANGYYVQFDTPGFSEFYVNGGHANMDLPLPIELIDFTLTKDGGDAILKWKTLSEVNSSHFEIEMAKGTAEVISGDFTKIGEVAAAGNSNQLLSYDYTDASSGKLGMYYYRLKLVDFDESYEYTEIKSLDFGNNLSISVYPNPNKGQFIININSNQTSSARYQILNHLGQTVYRNVVELVSGENIIEDEAFQNLTPGIYYIHVQLSDKELLEKILITSD